MNAVSDSSRSDCAYCVEPPRGKRPLRVDGPYGLSFDMRFDMRFIKDLEPAPLLLGLLSIVALTCLGVIWTFHLVP